MQEILEGEGILERWRYAIPGKRYRVSYHFEIKTEFVERPEFPRVAAKKHGTGSIISTNGEVLPEDEYRLYTYSGQVLKVTNLGSVWTI